MARRQRVGTAVPFVAAGIAITGFYATVRFADGTAIAGLVLMAFGIVAFFLAVYGRIGH